MAYIEMRTTLPDHRKAKAMSRDVGLRRPWIIGHLMCLWAWALENVPIDGSLAGIDPADLEEAAMWPEDRSGELVPAMIRAGFVDDEGGGLFIHDWPDYTGRLLRRREEDRARKAAERAAARTSTTSSAKRPAKRPADNAPRPKDNPAVSEGKGPKSTTLARARPRAGARPHRTAPHRTVPRTGTETRSSNRARVATDEAGAGASHLSIGSDDLRHPVAQVLATRYRWKAISAEQWGLMAEVVDNEYPTGTAKGRDPLAGWRWLAQQLADLPRDAGSPLDAFLGSYNLELARRRAADDQALAAHEERKHSSAGPIAAELAARIGAEAASNGHVPRMTRADAIAYLRPLRGTVDAGPWQQLLTRYEISEEDLTSDDVDWDPPQPEEPAHA